MEEIKEIKEIQSENSCSQKDISEELERYGQHQNLVLINRDGDNYYVECPSCKSTDLQKRSILSCRNCHTHFAPYFEDGCSTVVVCTDSGTIRGYDGEIKVVEFVKKDYFKKILHGRNDTPSALAKLKEKYPEMKVVTYRNDLQKNGKDAHNHSHYRRFAIIPLDDFPIGR